jgi:hypothetical protein
MRDLVASYPYSAETASFAPPASDHIDRLVLTANTPVAHPVPPDARFVAIQPDGDFACYARFGGAISMGPGSVTNGTAPEPARGIVRRIPTGVTTITVQASMDGAVHLAFWS